MLRSDLWRREQRRHLVLVPATARGIEAPSLTLAAADGPGWADTWIDEGPRKHPSIPRSGPARISARSRADWRLTRALAIVAGVAFVALVAWRFA